MKISETFVETNETIVRDMTKEEFIQWQKDIEEQAQLKAKQEQIETEAIAKRQALLNKLGITEDEARLLLGGN